MIETDMLYSYIKKEDWLKETADKFISKIAEGEFGQVYASRESLHEIYYVSKQEGANLDEIIRRIAILTAIPNLVFIETSFQIDLLAFVLMKNYGITSVFDAYYASTALNEIDDHIIVSTDKVYDCLPGLIRKDPRKL